MRFELPIVSGVPSNRYCRTSRVVLPGLTTDVCSMAVFGSCDAEPLGVILHMVPTPLATTVLFLAAGVWGRIIEAAFCYPRCRCPDDRHFDCLRASAWSLHHQEPAPSMGRARGGLTSKIHAVVDLPVRLALSPGETYDVRLETAVSSEIRSTAAC